MAVVVERQSAYLSLWNLNDFKLWKIIHLGRLDSTLTPTAVIVTPSSYIVVSCKVIVVVVTVDSELLFVFDPIGEMENIINGLSLCAITGEVLCSTNDGIVAFIWDPICPRMKVFIHSFIRTYCFLEHYKLCHPTNTVTS